MQLPKDGFYRPLSLYCLFHLRDVAIRPMFGGVGHVKRGMACCFWFRKGDFQIFYWLACQVAVFYVNGAQEMRQ